MIFCYIFFAPSVVHYTPLTLTAIYSIFSVFGMNYFVFVVLSLALNVIVIALVFFLAKRIFESEFLAGLMSLLFVSYTAHYQATSWIIADIGTHGATIFGLLAIILFMDYLKKSNNKMLIFSLISFSTSLLFKEISIGLIPVMLWIVWLYDEDKKREKTKLETKNYL